jgi:hypothetical protein
VNGKRKSADELLQKTPAENRRGHYRRLKKKMKFCKTRKNTEMGRN